MLTDRESHFGGALAINGLVSTTKDFTEDLDWLVASDAVDAQNHPLVPDKGQSDVMIWLFTVDGITGNGANITVSLLIDDAAGFGSATTRLLYTIGDPGAGGIAAGTEFGKFKIPIPTSEQHWRIVVEEDAATAVGAGATLSARVIE